MLLDYRLLHWTRLLRIENYEADQERKWPIGPDVFEECQAVAELPEVNEGDWVPLFEPHGFNEEHGPLQIEDYRLSEEDLWDWAQRCTRIRARITEKIKGLSQ